MESSSAHPAAPKAPPHYRYLIGSDDRPPDCQLWIGQLGRRSALFRAVRGRRDHAPYVRTLCCLWRPRNRSPAGRGASARGTVMVLSLRPEPTETRLSRPWRWGTGGEGQSLLAAPVRPGLPNCLLFSSAAPLQRPPLRGIPAGRRLGPWPAQGG